MKPVWRHALANVIGGVLVGYGLCAFVCFMGLTEAWYRAAPIVAQPDLGLIYAHGSNAGIRYYSAFQAVASGVPLFSSMPLAMLGMLVAPKKNFGLRRPFNWDADDPWHLFKLAAILMAIATPFLLSTVGASLLDRFLAHGFLPTLG